MPLKPAQGLSEGHATRPRQLLMQVRSPTTSQVAPEGSAQPSVARPVWQRPPSAPTPLSAHVAAAHCPSVLQQPRPTQVPLLRQLVELQASGTNG